MDKFGIFKLLNSFLTASNKQNDQENGQTSNSSADFINAISSVLQSNSGNATKSNPTPDLGNLPEKISPPLQSSMLYTMRSHDAFVKRVKDKNPLG